MAQNDCKTQFITAVLKFKATVHVDGENAYKELISELKDISLKFVDDLEGADVHVVLHSIKQRDGHHFKQSLTVHHEQQRFDPYAVHDEDWDQETEELVTDIFKYHPAPSPRSHSTSIPPEDPNKSVIPNHVTQPSPVPSSYSEDIMKAWITRLDQNQAETRGKTGPEETVRKH